VRDTLRIETSDGYVAGPAPLSNGNLQVRR
jgi:hypothetical protein